MYPYIKIGNITIPTYWLCGLLGLIASSILAFKRHKRFKDIEQVDITNAAGIGLVGMIIGARFVYIISILPVVIKHWGYLKEHTDQMKEILYNGMVFYGGLLGFIFAIQLYLKKYKIDKLRFWNYFTPMIPLFHAFGRLGCFANGCCYGIESEKLGLYFKNSISGPQDIKFFPIQLVGFAGEIILCILSIEYEKKHGNQAKTLFFYLLVYSICRFIYEFFRGDLGRGIFFGLSTSQWISIFVLISVIWLEYLSRKNAESDRKRAC